MLCINNCLGLHITLQRLRAGSASLLLYSDFRGLMIRILCFSLLSSPAGIQSYKECGYAVLLITNDFYYLLPHCVQMGEPSAQVSTTIGWTAADVHSASWLISLNWKVLWGSSGRLKGSRHELKSRLRSDWGINHVFIYTALRICSFFIVIAWKC